MTVWLLIALVVTAPVCLLIGASVERQAHRDIERSLMSRRDHSALSLLAAVDRALIAEDDTWLVRSLESMPLAELAIWSSTGLLLHEYAGAVQRERWRNERATDGEA